MPKVQKLFYPFSLHPAVHSTAPPPHLLLSPSFPSLSSSGSEQNRVRSMGSGCSNTELHVPFRAMHFSNQAILNTSVRHDTVNCIAMNGGKPGWLTGPRGAFLCRFIFVLVWDILQESVHYAHQMNSFNSVRESSITHLIPSLLWVPDTSYFSLFLNLLPISHISTTLLMCQHIYM